MSWAIDSTRKQRERFLHFCPPPILPNPFFVFELKSSFSRPKVLKRQPEVGQVLSLPMTQHRKQYQGSFLYVILSNESKTLWAAGAMLSLLACRA